MGYITCGFGLSRPSGGDLGQGRDRGLALGQGRLEDESMLDQCDTPLCRENAQARVFNLERAVDWGCSREIAAVICDAACDPGTSPVERWEQVLTDPTDLQKYVVTLMAWELRRQTDGDMDAPMRWDVYPGGRVPDLYWAPVSLPSVHAVTNRLAISLGGRIERISEERENGADHGQARYTLFKCYDEEGTGASFSGYIYDIFFFLSTITRAQKAWISTSVNVGKAA